MIFKPTMPKRYKQIPEEFLDEFISKQVLLIKNRVKLFSVLAVMIYFLATFISFIAAPDTFKKEEVWVWAMLVLSSFIVNYINKRLITLKAVKLNAYLFTALLLVILTRVVIIYYTYLNHASSIYLFLLFLVTFTIPWLAIEVIPITIMHILAYSFLFVYAKWNIVQFSPEPQAYSDGILLLSMGLILCFAIRKKETMRDMENFVLLKQVEAKNAQMKKELELATRVHRTLMPKSVSTDKVDIAVMYMPMYYIGGDYAKFHFLDKDKLIFIICDVTGHGVSAALLVNRLHTEFERLVRDAKAPGVLLKELDIFIKRDFEGIDMYLSAFCCQLDFSDMRIAYSNHGHPPQYIYQVTKADIQRLDPQAGLLGLPFNTETVYQHELGFSKGDTVLLFTDGVTETRGKDGEMFGKERLESFIRKNSSLQADLFNSRLLDELNLFKRGNFQDDIFIVNIHTK